MHKVCESCPEYLRAVKDSTVIIFGCDCEKAMVEDGRLEKLSPPISITWETIVRGINGKPDKYRYDAFDKVP
jgi:hypothetical protein